VLYRVAQEALTNVAKHARASQVIVNIRPLAGAARMEIKDNGRSFEVERVLRTQKGKRLGLLGMRERLEMVGGQFSIESAPDAGTTVMAQIPFGKCERGGGGRSP
jgi:signal transduction histidine kinase